MQGVILAAGTATRLKPLTDNCPKCLLPIGKTNILHRTITNLLWNKIDDIIIVTGFLNHKIEEYVKNNFPSLNVTFIHNKDYENNNNCFSLWLARNHIKNNFLLLDSDILFQKEIIKRIIDANHECCLAVNCHECGEEEIKVVVDGNYRIKEISKIVEPKIALGESIGIEFFSGKGMKDMLEILNKRVNHEGKINEWYEASFQEWIDNGGTLHAVDVSDYLAMECDFAEDLKLAEETIIPLLDKE